MVETAVHAALGAFTFGADFVPVGDLAGCPVILFRVDPSRTLRFVIAIH
ncbi:MAG: hypothetical protein NTU79_08645 [Planctomycetota bacterium]|nr:hypothetical protein [Planctomycetota bacterium]